MAGFSKFAYAQKCYWATNYAKDYTEERVILLFDMDSFEVQVHQDDWMRLHEPPRVVVNSSNRIVAVSYEAKQLGINRDDTPYFKDAQLISPDLVKIEIPPRPNGRPNTGIALRASGRIVQTIRAYLSKHYRSATFQFSSNDEFFVDVTHIVNRISRSWNKVCQQLEKYWENTFIYNNTPQRGFPFEKYESRLERIMELGGWRDCSSLLERQEIRLLLGSSIASEIVQEILNTTTYQSSVGIGSNKLMAKIASSVHKPGSITVAAPSGFWKFSREVSLTKIPGLGSGTGKAVKNAYPNATHHSMARIQKIKKPRLAQILNNFNTSFDGHRMALEFKNAAFGLCSDPVILTCCYKTSTVERPFYRVKDQVVDQNRLRILLEEQCEEMKDKLDFERSFNKRWPNELKIFVKFIGEPSISHTIQMGPRCGLKYIKTQVMRRKIQVPRSNPRVPSSPRIDCIKISANF